MKPVSQWIRCAAPLVIALLGGCASPTQSTTPLSKPAPFNPTLAAKLYLYEADCCGVLNGGGVKVYAPGQQKVLRRLVKWAKIPQLIRLDRTGTLYVLNGSNVGPGGIAVSEFDEGHENVSRRVGYFYWVTTFALDRSNELFVANCNTCYDSGAKPDAKVLDSVTVYGAHQTKLSRTITEGIHSPWSLAFDGAGDLYVSNGGIKGKHASVTVYAPGSKTPLRTITRGIKHPGELAIDKSNDLFVTNGTAPVSGTSEIIEYAPGSDTILRTITDEIADPDSLALDASGTLYVSNWPLSPSGPGWASIYASGSTKPEYVIATKIEQPVDIALGGDGNLYVANLGGWVSVYAAGARKPLRVIESGGLGDPRSLTFGSE